MLRRSQVQASSRGLDDAVGDRRKFTESDREPAWSTSGVHRKLIERLVRSLPEDPGRFAESSEDQLTS
ncbi:hypothetical protein B296_00011645 [Ensete ventricosum]|uniref:Uncharacterized protein n=1 Tax=Ensete ventricosum TaxID=4639 RepID=A0A427AQZ8_ENSVE|nr:hypothetical protein B296_00011645 [Ensete ventricosum]